MAHERSVQWHERNRIAEPLLSPASAPSLVLPSALASALPLALPSALPLALPPLAAAALEAWHFLFSFAEPLRLRRVVHWTEL